MSYIRNLIKAFRLKGGDPDHTQVSSPANGRLFELAACSDPLFAQGTMGSGFVVFPDDGVVSSPVDGTVEMVYETLHAFGLRAADGREVLVHVGLDTVELNGAPFKCRVARGEEVRRGERLVHADLDVIHDAGLSSEIVVVFPDTAANALHLDKTGVVYRGEIIGSIGELPD